METISVSTNQHVDIDYPVAGLGERVSARLIDFALFIVVFFAFLFGLSFSGVLDGTDFGFAIMFGIYGVLFVFYDLFCEILMNGQSIGKKILKIKVISLDGGQPSIGQYLIRWIFRIVDFVLASPVGGLVAVAVTENKQRIGDIVAGTILIKTQPRTKIDHIAFHPVEENYTPRFPDVHLLHDRDVELIHEVIGTYYQTMNTTIVYRLAGKVTQHLGITDVGGLNELDFLKTVVADYSHVTSRNA